MSSTDIIKAKRVPKQEIKYKITLTEEQKEAKRIIYNNKVTALWGQAGTAKTATTVHTALDLFFKKEVEKIYILRPAVAMEDLGYMKGSLQEKLQFYFVPIMHNLYQNYDKVKIDKMVEQGDIEIVALAFIQGVTIHNSILICDEAENITEKQMRMILTRLGKGSKIVFTGDIDQIMLKDVKSSGFKKLIDLEGYLNGFASFELKQNYRDEFVQEILKLY